MPFISRLRNPHIKAQHTCLYDMTPEQATHVLKRYEKCSWVAVVRSVQRSAIMRCVRRLEQMGQRFDKGYKIKLKKMWWETRERTATQSDGIYEIWHSKQEQDRAIMDLQVTLLQ